MPTPTAADADAAELTYHEALTDAIWALAVETAEIECLWNNPDLRWADDSHPTGPWVLIAGPPEGCQRARIVVARDGEGLRAEVSHRYAYTIGQLTDPDDDSDPLFVTEAEAVERAAERGSPGGAIGIWKIDGAYPQLIAIAYDMDLFRPAYA